MFIKKSLSIFILLIPILGIYKVFNVNLDLLVLFFGFMLILFLKKIYIEKKILLFFFLFSFISFLSIIFNDKANISLFINNTLFFIIYSVLFSSIILNVNNLFSIKVLRILGVFSTIILGIQFVLYNFFSLSQTFFLPLSLIEPPDKYFIAIEIGRPHSLFLEPAHYAIFILPIFWLDLKSKKYLNAILYIIGLVLSTSTTGFAVSLILIAYYFLLKKVNFKNVVMFIFLIMLFSYSFMYFNDFFMKNINKLNGNQLEENIRIVGAMELIPYILDNHFFFGIGLNQMQSTFNIVNYSNSFLMIFISFGIIGILLFIILLMYMFKQNNDIGLLIIFISILFTDQIIFNRNFFFLISTIYLFNNHENPIKNEKKYNIFLS